MTKATTNRLAAKALRLAESPEWTRARAAWVLRSTTGCDRTTAELALQTLRADLDEDADRVTSRAAETLAALVEQLPTPRQPLVLSA